jgi:hypothetical protein
VSLDNDETVVDDSTELENNLEQTTEESSEQSELDENQGVATEANESEQAGETEDDFNLGDVLSGKAEPEEKESKVPRSTRRALRKNKRLEKELAQSQQQVEQLTNSKAPNVQAQVPERDWDNETDEQYNFRSMNVALGHQQQVNDAGQQHAQNIKRANEGLIEQQKVIETYSEEVDKLSLPNYDDAESRVLDAMPDNSLTYMSKINPAMTAKIIYHLDHNPEKLALFADLAHNNANGFNYEFGKLETAITSLENSARRKHKAVSKATGDKALDNSGSQGSSLEDKMQTAANKGDYAAYRKLKAQRNKK